MKGMRYPDEFRSEAVKQITERGYSVADVAKNLGISTKSLYKWRREMSGHNQPQLSSDVMALKQEVTRLNAALKRATEERDILKKAAVSSTGQCNSICINHQEVLNGKDGTTWAIRSREIGAMAQMAGRPEPDRHWFSPR
ncbi:transposase [Fluviibacter phosphoraccumulans]|jgi:transposase|uniref:transposase n=1 Tax=Fluviibacter phosphoraccumulans TaxID=1751046 RepID=UPI0024E2772D|nr:transposase [Fluviibacter phosphoraccumulans]